MKLSELIAKIGDENIQVQFLHECVVNGKLTKKGVHVTFGTNCASLHDLIAEKPAKVGIIVWVPFEKFVDARAEASTVGPGTKPASERQIAS